MRVRILFVVVTQCDLYQAFLHRRHPDPAGPVSAEPHLEPAQVLGRGAPRREGSQLCRQVQLPSPVIGEGRGMVHCDQAAIMSKGKERRKSGKEMGKRGGGGFF
jgi:hypothetical protein